MAKKGVDPIKAKADKQKKLAIGGAVLLVLVLALEGPKVLKRMHGSSGGQVPAWLAASRAQAGGAAAPGGVALAAPTLAGGNPTGATTSTPTGLDAADAAPTASVGQLASFSRFASKDPFAAQVPTGTTVAVPPPPTPTVAGPGSGSTGAAGGAGAPNVTPPRAPAPTFASAVIAVNGTLGTVGVGTDFGVPLGQAAATATPLFHLLSVKAHSAKIAIAGGSYADGSNAITIREGKPTTLKNTADGTQYTLQLYPQGTQVGGSTTAPTPAPTPAPVAPAPLPPATTTGTTTTNR